MNQRYEWTDDMDELSGFGGSYEAGMRVMVKAGCEWMDAHPEANPAFHGYTGIIGVYTEDNADAKALSKAMTDAADSAYPDGGATGAMHQYAASAVLFIKAKGWDEFARQLRERKAKEQSV